MKVKVPKLALQNKTMISEGEGERSLISVDSYGYSVTKYNIY